jgi:TIR domain/SEC-C motif
MLLYPISGQLAAVSPTPAHPQAYLSGTEAAVLAWRLAKRHAGMVFVADDLGAWLIFILAEAGRKKLTTWALGSEQERALRAAATAAVQRTAAELCPGDDGQAEQLAMVVSQVFDEPVASVPLAGHATVLEALQAGIAGQLAVLDDDSLTGTGQSSADVLEVPGTVLAAKLTGHLLREFMVRGSQGGPLFPLASQLNDDLTHLQGQRIEAVLGQLTEEVREALARLDRQTQRVISVPSSPAGSRSRLVPVHKCRPAWVGVHPTVARPGAANEDGWGDLPEYIARDHDERLHTRLRSAAAGGGCVILVGGSSVGKTRSLYEAVREVLPDWQIFLPADAAAVRDAMATLPPRTLVWLDDTPNENYLTETAQGGLGRPDLIGLLDPDDSNGPFIVVNTLWAGHYQKLASQPQQGESDYYRDAREFLALAGDPVDVSEEFSRAERSRARKASRNDPRIAAALDDKQFGITQHLAGARDLVRRWQDANPYTKAVLNAAIDARRLATSPPLRVELLKQGAVGYVSDRHRATAARDWFDTAMQDATVPGRGAVAPLLPVSGLEPAVGSISGYSIADYLEQYGINYRYLAPIPSALWDALASRVTGSKEMLNLAGRARARLLYSYAEPLYSASIATGGPEAVYEYVNMLAQQGRETDLRAFFPISYDAKKEVARILYSQKREEALRELAADGSVDPLMLLADLLAEQGRIDEAIAEVKKAAEVAKSRPWSGKVMWAGEVVLPRLLLRYGRTEELAALAAEGDSVADLFIKQASPTSHDSKQITAGASGIEPNDTEDQEGPSLTQDQLDGVIEKLRARVAKGDSDAFSELIHMLADHDRDHELRVILAATGDMDVLVLVWRVLRRLGRDAELAAFIRYGLNPDGTIATATSKEDSLIRLGTGAQKADTSKAEAAASRRSKVAGHAFISYAREDSHRVDQLQRMLEAVGIPVWRDTTDLGPGEDWRTKVRQAITDNTLAFIACFSRASLARGKSYQNEELTLAIQQLRLRRPDEPWLIPVRFDECEIPDWDIGSGRTFTSIQHADLFDDRSDDTAAHLIAAILRILGRHSDGEALEEDRGPDVSAQAITDRWRFTTDDVDAPLLARMDFKRFDFPVYSRPTLPPYMRVQTLVACNRLGKDPKPQKLQSLFRGLLAQPPINELLRDVYIFDPGLVWQSRATDRRSHLEADLSHGDLSQSPPKASAILLLPEADRNHAELSFHVDFSVMSYVFLPDWNRRITCILGVVGELANFLTDYLGLTTSNNPAAEVGILLRHPHSLLGMATTGFDIEAMRSPPGAQEFTAFAIADPAGKTAAEVAGKIVLELSKRLLHLEGSEAELSGLVGSSTNPDSLKYPPVGGGSLCPCGSGQKFQNCHGRQAWETWARTRA